MSKMSPEYISWSAMKQRCYNPKHTFYKDYGGRGITVDESWLHSFPTFLRDMGKRPTGTSLDRRDVNGNYDPANCRWATSAQQGKNRRKRKYNPKALKMALDFLPFWGYILLWRCLRGEKIYRHYNES